MGNLKSININMKSGQASIKKEKFQPIYLP